MGSRPYLKQVQTLSGKFVLLARVRETKLSNQQSLQVLLREEANLLLKDAIESVSSQQKN